MCLKRYQVVYSSYYLQILIESFLPLTVCTLHLIWCRQTNLSTPTYCLVGDCRVQFVSEWGQKLIRRKTQETKRSRCRWEPWRATRQVYRFDLCIRGHDSRAIWCNDDLSSVMDLSNSNVSSLREHHCCVSAVVSSYSSGRESKAKFQKISLLEVSKYPQQETEWIFLLSISCKRSLKIIFRLSSAFFTDEKVL